jgi:GNAT superfamily N-acetyltransferase
MSAYTVRRATVADAAIIATHRASMFRDMGELAVAEVPAFEAATEAWIAERMTRGDYLAWLVEYDARVVAGGGVLVSDLWPTPRIRRASRTAHVASMYTEREHRRRGLARLVVRAILDWCATNAIELVTLRASAEGQPVYEQLGFTPDPKTMRLFVAPARQR